MTNRDPRPRRRGDELRAAQIARAMARRVSVDVLAPITIHERLELAPGVRLVGYRRTAFDRLTGVLRATVLGAPMQSGLYESRDLRRRLLEISGGYDLVVVQLARSLPYLGAVRGAATFADLIDCLSLGFERRARFDHRWRRPFLRFEARRLRRAERTLCRGVDSCCVVCERDREALKRVLQDDPGTGREPIVVPLAVPLRTPVPVETAGVSDEPPTLTFTGNLGYWVNADAATWFVRRVWPELRRQRRQLRLVIAGSRPTPQLRRVARRGGAELIEDPPDLDAIIAAATVSLAPMRGGSGVPVKVLESWALGTPVVASAWAAAGVSAEADRELLVAESVAQWRDACLRLVERPESAQVMVARARARLGRDYSEEAVSAAVDRWLERAPTALGLPVDRKPV